MKKLTYCFEQEYVANTLKNTAVHGLAVVDTEGCESAVRDAVKRGVWVYGYLNAGALENERSYYKDFKHLRLAPYDGWDGEYWVDVTDKAWQDHLFTQAKKIKELGAIGVYLDNTDVYYMCCGHLHRAMNTVPKAQDVYKALAQVVYIIQKGVGLIVMPNGGDSFVRRFITQYPGIIQTINQEGLFYEDFKKQPKSETAYRKEYMKWAAEHVKGKIRGIEYCKKPSEIAKVKAYYAAHGWDVYISKHKDLRGD